MDITRTENDHKGQFVATIDGQQAGLMTYTWAGDDRIIIDHTETDKAFGGKGVGKRLVLEGAEVARQKNIKVIPLCPFAKSVFDRNKEIQDVL